MRRDEWRMRRKRGTGKNGGANVYINVCPKSSRNGEWNVRTGMGFHTHTHTDTHIRLK